MEKQKHKNHAGQSINVLMKEKNAALPGNLMQGNSAGTLTGPYAAEFHTIAGKIKSKYVKNAKSSLRYYN